MRATRIQSLFLFFMASLLVLSLALPAQAAPSAERRVALVIGNGAYKAGPLKNPANDARDMAAALRGAGFEVILRENAGLRQMNEAIDQFWNSLKRGGVGLFFFAGHGLQVAGENYLVPVDARIAMEKDVQYECVNAGKVLGRMEDAGNGLNIVILDACRNNPFARSFRSESRGLAKMDAPTGSLIAFATAPGDVAADGEGKNGLYTSHLLRHLNTPGLTIENVLKRTRIGVAADSSRLGRKQTPWESSSLMGDFFFVGGGQGAGQVASLGPASVPQAAAQAKPLPVPAAPVAHAPATQPASVGEGFGSMAGTYKLAGFSSTVNLTVTLRQDGRTLSGVAQGSNGPFDFDNVVRDVRFQDGQLQLTVMQKGGIFPDIWYRFTCAPKQGLDRIPILRTEKRYSTSTAFFDSTEFPQAYWLHESGAPSATSGSVALQSASPDSGRRRPGVEQASVAVPAESLSGLTVRLIYTDDMLSQAEAARRSLQEQGATVQFFRFIKNDSYRGHIGKLYAAPGYDGPAARIAELVRPHTPVTVVSNNTSTSDGQQFNLWIAR